MTREEAIKRLEWLEMVAEYVDSVTIGSKCTEDWNAYNMAIAALREQEERSKGCEYCNGLLKSDTEDFTMPNASKKEYDIVTIRFCPMCGRRLEET